MSEVSRTKSAFWGTISTQIFTIVSMAVSIISTPLMLKYLNNDEYGLFIIFFQIINYLALFDFGLSTAVIRNLALHRSNSVDDRVMVNKIMSTGVFVAAFFGVIVAVAGSLFAPFVPEVYDLSADLARPCVLIVVSLSFLVGVQFLQRGLGGIFFAHHRQTLIATPLFIINLLVTGLTLLLLSRGYGLWTFIYVNVFQLLSNGLVQLLLLRKYYPEIVISKKFYSHDMTKSMLGYGFFMFVHGLAMQVILYTDRLVIGKVLAISLVAIFSITVRIPEVGMTLLGRVSENILPAVSEIVVYEGVEKVRSIFKRVMLLITTLSLSAFWMMIAFDEWFINLWVGKQYFAGQQVLMLALIIMIQQAVTRIGVYFLNAKSIAKPLSYMTMVEAAINLSLSIYFGKMLGMKGILMGTIVASCLTTIWYVPFLLQKHLDINFITCVFRPAVKPVVYISLLGIVLCLMIHNIKYKFSDSWFVFLLMALAYGFLFVVFLWKVFLKNEFYEYVPVKYRRFF
jgi:O-antigen/teichoic acid export membrane protein